MSASVDLSGRPDLNRGPHRPERCALPGCATPRGRLSLAVPARHGVHAADYLANGLVHGLADRVHGLADGAGHGGDGWSDGRAGGGVVDGAVDLLGGLVDDAGALLR